MLHPDTQYQFYRERMQERREKSALLRQLPKASGAKPSWRARILLRSGELLISLGTHLQCQVQPQICDPRHA